MVKRLVVISIVLGGFFGGVFWFHHYMEQAYAKAKADYSPPPTMVSAAKADKQSWINHIHAVGEVFSLSSVELSPEDAGTVIAVHFDSGEQVKAGETLVDISHKVETASMAALNADVRKAREDYRRYQALYKSGAVAKAALDKYRTDYRDAKSRAHAQVARIKRNTIDAPFSGTVGICNIELGDYVQAGQPLLRLTKLDPIYIDFFVRQQDLSKVSTGLEVKADVDAWPGETFKGQLTSTNPFLSKKTRRVHARATFNNKDGKLLPGMFCTVAVVLPEKQEVVTAPATAVTYRMAGDTVYVLTDKKQQKGGKDGKSKTVYTAKEVLVKVGDTREGRTVLHNGVSAGDLLVTSGQNKLYNGALVAVDNSVDPAKAGK
ncbi:MAG: efflux RND transporter periplasmic adaptor subunit [Desulfovibrionaceae bacterium]